MKPKQFLLHCLADRRGGQWQALCLEFDLMAQAETFEEAVRKLEAQINEYVFDALAGEDKAHADQLLSRRAPLRLWARYHWYGLMKRLNLEDGFRRFKEPIPMVPRNHRLA